MKTITSALICLIPILAVAASGPRGPVRSRSSLDQPNIQNWVQESGSVRMNITNTGYFGNSGPQSPGAATDPCPPGTDWAPQCEFPAGSGQQYLYQAGLWIGALIEVEGNEHKRVSVGIDGWFNPSISELFPGEDEEGEIVIRSNVPDTLDCFGNEIYDPTARANQEVTAVYSDTLTDEFWMNPDPIDGSHRPLGIEVVQKTLTWTDPAISNFVIFEFTIRNIGEEFLKNVYIGLYCDIDTGPWDQFEHHIDDLAGFLLTDPETGDTMRIAYVADNDARPPEASGGAFDNPHVAGAIALSSNITGSLRQSFNWWISNGDVDLDFGPAWEAYAVRDSSGMGWTENFGTPVGDERKYQIMSNSENDYDQVYVDDAAWVADHPQETFDPLCGQELVQDWTTPDAGNAEDLADGFDTRFLYSWGPVGIFDYTDFNGCDVYRLNPGEEFTFAVAYILGADFHDPENPQPSNTNIDPSLFDFSGLVESARAARTVFDEYLSVAPPREDGAMPRTHLLHQNYPNPFNPTTRIPFEIAVAGEVKIEVFNVTGQTVSTPADEYYSAGLHEVIVDGASLPSGIYLYRLSAGDVLRTKKMVLLK